MVEVRLYLDVETYRPRPEDIFINEKVVAVGVIEDYTEYAEKSSAVWEEPQVKIRFFTEWEMGSEKEVLYEFYNYLEELLKRSKFVNVMGFNILKFDIPLLIQKAVEHGLRTYAELNKLWNRVPVIDYLQIFLPTNNMVYKGLKLESLAKILEEAVKDVEVPKLYSSGKVVKDLYERGEYEEIIKHLETDLRIIRLIDLNHETVLKLAAERRKFLQLFNNLLNTLNVVAPHFISSLVLNPKTLAQFSF